MMTAIGSLSEAVGLFVEGLADSGIDVNTPVGAEGSCYRVSDRFAAALNRCGVPGSMLCGYRSTGEYTYENHWVVLVDETVWDWTARQFDPAAPVPRVVPLQQWRQEWPDNGHGLSAIPGMTP